jgi:hypothetical protein
MYRGLKSGHVGQDIVDVHAGQSIQHEPQAAFRIMLTEQHSRPTEVRIDHKWLSQKKLAAFYG